MYFTGGTMVIKQTEAKDELERFSIFLLVGRVAEGTLPLDEARKRLREHVSSLSEAERELWKKNARDQGLHMLRVAEAFLQELTVLGAGQ
jgi:hypothetical protein